jgi:hypothetical protein
MAQAIEATIENFIEEMFFESLTTTSGSSDDSEDEKVRVKRIKVELYVERTVSMYSDIQFKEHFRLTRVVANCVITSLGHSGVIPRHTFGPEKINEEKAALLTIWFLANKETFRQISDRFDVSLSSSHRVLKRVLKFFLNVKNCFIKWPDAERSEQISEVFQRKYNIRGIVGVIDGSHILIKRPKNDTDSYVNRKGLHSIILQGIVDCKKSFTDIYVGEPGSLHDARVLRRSSLYRKAEEEELFRDYFLLGDLAYPSLSWLVPPFKDNGNLTNNHRLFNYRHSSQRIIIEHSFGLLKQLLENLSIHLVVQCVMAACVLHNICISNNDILQERIILEPNIEDVFEGPGQNRPSRREEIFRIMFE